MLASRSIADCTNSSPAALGVSSSTASLIARTALDELRDVAIAPIQASRSGFGASMYALTCQIESVGNFGISLSVTAEVVHQRIQRAGVRVENELLDASIRRSRRSRGRTSAAASLCFFLSSSSDMIDCSRKPAVETARARDALRRLAVERGALQHVGERLRRHVGRFARIAQRGVHLVHHGERRRALESHQAEVGAKQDLPRVTQLSNWSWWRAAMVP